MLSAHVPSAGGHILFATKVQAPPASVTVVMVAAADADPVQRLTTGNQFHGYDYIPTDGSAPPVLPPPDLSDLPITLSRTGSVSVGQQLPKNEKPSVQPGDVVVSDAGPSPTPLAQTPSAAGPSGAIANAARQSLAVPNPGAVIRPAVPSASVGVAKGPLPITLPPIYFGTVAMVAPAASLFAGSQAIPSTGIPGGLVSASNHAADALALLSSEDGAVGTAAYNFVHFNPAALLNDALAAFTRESASVSLSTIEAPAGHSAARAWTITGAVIGADLLLLGYGYRKGRRSRAAAREPVATAAAAPRRRSASRPG